MKDSPSPPPAPDPNQTAQAQTQSNLQTAIANARLNRVNQQTPWGSINYTEGPVDANGVPTYSSNIQLSPAQQQLLEQQQGMSAQRNTIAQNLLGQTGQRLGQPLDLSHLHAMRDVNGQSYAGAIGQQAPAPVSNASTPVPGMNPGSSGMPDLQTLMRSNPQVAQALIGALVGMAGRNPAMGAAAGLAAGSMGNNPRMGQPMGQQGNPQQGNQQALFQQFMQWMQSQQGGRQ